MISFDRHLEDRVENMTRSIWLLLYSSHKPVLNFRFWGMENDCSTTYSMDTFGSSREYKDVPMLFRVLDCDPADQDVFARKWWLVQIKHWYLYPYWIEETVPTLWASTPDGHHLFREVWSLHGGNTRSTNIYHYINTVKTIRCSTMITPQNYSHFTNIGYLSALFLSVAR